MSENPTDRGARFYAHTYDSCVQDWPGEIDFYRALAAETTSDWQLVQVIEHSGCVGVHP